MLIVYLPVDKESAITDESHCYGNRDYSMESAHEWFLVMSCDALKKTNEWVSLMHHMNKSRSSTFHGMMFLFDTNLDFFTI